MRASERPERDAVGRGRPALLFLTVDTSRRHPIRTTRRASESNPTTIYGSLPGTRELRRDPGRHDEQSHSPAGTRSSGGTKHLRW
jgi:hypothetical protein